MSQYDLFTGQPEPRVKPEDLTDKEHFAFNFALAMVGGPGSKAMIDFTEGYAKVLASGVTQADARRDLQEGIKGLLEKRLIEAKKNGEGDWVPTVVHLERIDKLLLA